MRILIILKSQQKGFFISLGRKLAELGHEVSFAPRDKDVAALIERSAPELAGDMAISEKHKADIPPSDAVQTALQVEERYGVHLSMLLSYDRALGRGYIFNADRYPPICRAKWPHERKLLSILKRFDYAEHLMERYRPELILGILKDKVIRIVAGARGASYLSPTPIKLGGRFLWSDDAFITSTAFLKALRENIAKSVEELPPAGVYAQEAGSKFALSSLGYTWRKTLRDVANVMWNDCKALIRGSRKRDSYPLFGWAPSLVRRQLNYGFFLRNGVRPAAIAQRRAVYVPLHLEPEVALLALSPEFNNSMEMIAWISKSCPADVLVVVKEQPLSFGVRSRRYYEQLMQIGNVVLAHPDTSSWEWISAADVTATITGTAATEAVAFGRPVLSFGRHQAVNLLPTVRLATDYESTCTGLSELLSLDRSDPVFELSRRAFYGAQMSCSFAFSGFEKVYGSSQPQVALAEKALLELMRICPGLNSQGVDGTP
jgi:hypothetical protein